MKKILILSDTHGCCENDILKYTAEADEVWHAGDWGTIELAHKIGIDKLKSVYGNIDGKDVRDYFGLYCETECEGLKVLMVHIGGYPDKYAKGISALIAEKKPDIFVCGHSHILRVMKDSTLNTLYINPGAAGRHGFHLKRTMVRLRLEDGKVVSADVVDLGKRALISN